MSSGNKWSLAENFGTPLNNTRHNFVESVTPDGNELLLGNHYFKIKTAAEQGTYDGVSVSFRKTNGWTYPKNIEIRNFKNYDQYVNYYLTNDGKAMLMGIEMDDTYGVADIYVSFYENDSTWSAPKNLGSVINSAGSEGTPFLAADGVTLYYCSDGFADYGSSDIYMSRRLDDTWQHWSEPLNIGPPINTPEWDAYYTLPASGDYAYYVSQNNSLGSEDIFRIKLPAIVKPQPVVLVMGRVFNANTNQPLEAKINYQFLPNGESAGTARSEPDSGRYKIVLPAGKVYGWNAVTEGYYSISENFNTDSLHDYTEIKKDIRMLPVEKGQVIRLNNIFFDFAKADLKPSSFPELDRLVTFLSQQLTVNISIDGHTDDSGSDADNQSLSTSRAASVRSYLVAKGISEQRIESHGYGESRPIALNDNEEHRQLNRRVEFRILSR